MTPSKAHRVTGSLVLGVVVSACAAAPREAGPSPSPDAGRPVQSSPEAIAQARADSVRHPYTAADVHFMSGMIGHHAQAIVMARWAPSHGAGSSVRILCERIINAQHDEIRIAQQWLQDRQQQVPDGTPAARMVMNGVEHEMLMPGMLSEAQLKQLDQARGTDFDRLFLLLMIQHHQGAVTMVKTLFDTWGAAQDQTIFKFATDINVDQTTEIARMQKMLLALSSPPQ